MYKVRVWCVWLVARFIVHVVVHSAQTTKSRSVRDPTTCGPCLAVLGQDK